MGEYERKSNSNEHRAVSTNVSKQPESEPAGYLVDNRPKAVAQRKLQQALNTSSQPQQTTLDQPAQLKENNTGLPDRLKAGIENISGHSMDDVKVHYNSSKPAQLNAHAYAQGTEIHLASGQEKHLPHEAWHVVQQKQGRVRPTMQMKGKVNINDDKGLEHEADIMGEKATNSGVAYARSVSFASIASNSQKLTVQARMSPIQLVKLNMRTDGTISGVSKLPSRPTSNIRGKQGQHLTAYVVFEDTILAKVKDRTPKQAAAALQEYLDEILTLPGMQLKTAKYLRGPIEVNKGLLDTEDPKLIGKIINNILTIRNKVPGTAQQGVGGGHDESGQSGRLESVETALRNGNWDKTWDEDIVADQCRYMVWRLLDYDPPNPTNEKSLEEIAKHVTTHFKSVISAYPHVNKWLISRDDFFQGYLEAHRDSAGMPLKRVKYKELQEVFKLVYKAL